MTQSKVWGDDKKEAARTLKDAAETGFPLPLDEAEVLQLAAAGDPVCYERGFNRILSEAIDRNPRTEARFARDDARCLRKYVGQDWDLLSAEDAALLKRASRATDITTAQIAAVKNRFREARGQQAVEGASWHPTAASSALKVQPVLWPDLVHFRRNGLQAGLAHWCAEIAFFIEDAETTGDWMEYGNRDSYIRGAWGVEPEVIDWAYMGTRLLPPCIRQGRASIEQSGGATINRGPCSDTFALTMKREEWPDLSAWRRVTVVRYLPDACEALLFYVADAETTGSWLDYESRDAYLQDGLGVTAALVDWAIEGQRIYAATSRA